MQEFKHLLGKYSYINILSPLSMQHPRSATRFLCCSLAIHETSFINSSIPCLESFASLFTATSCPLVNKPCDMKDYLVEVPDSAVVDSNLCIVMI